jgi:uncharacterized membrane protein
VRLSSAWFLGVAICIIFVALFLRLAPISNESVDCDELFSRHVAMSEASQALNLVRQDLVHPPLYYLLLKGTLPKGSPASALDIRLLSLAAGVASIMIVILAGSLVAPLRGPAILAAFLLALNKTHIFYSQQARSYALFCFLAGMLLLWALLLDRYERDRMYWLAGTTLMTALLYTHYFGAFYCAAVILPVVLSKSPKRLKILAVTSGVVAFTVFLPWVYQEVPVYRGKFGISSNLDWQGLPTFFDLKMIFADHVGIPGFRGATSLAFLIGAVLICCALLPTNSRNEEEVLNFRIRLTLALTALMPPLLTFFLTWRPLRLPIFGERHVLPSMAATLLLVSYGLWRLAARASKPLRVLVLMIGAIILSVFQAVPVWSNWPGPSREPYAAIADWLKHTDLNVPVYTTWPYGIGEPVEFYLERSRPIDELPADPTKLPDKFIVLYRPASRKEDDAVHSLLNRFGITEEKYYSGHNSRWGTDLLVLQER